MRVGTHRAVSVLAKVARGRSEERMDPRGSPNHHCRSYAYGTLAIGRSSSDVAMSTRGQPRQQRGIQLRLPKEIPSRRSAATQPIVLYVRTREAVVWVASGVAARAGLAQLPDPA